MRIVFSFFFATFFFLWKPVETVDRGVGFGRVSARSWKIRASLA